MSMNQTGTINRFHQDKWMVNFSNVPSVEGNKVDVQLYDLYVKSVVLPNLSLDTQNSDLMNFSVRQPTARVNDQLNFLTIEFKVDEFLENYYSLYEWMQVFKYGVKTDTQEFLRLNTIKAIEVFLLDNQKRKKGVYRFTECIITDLGALNLEMGSSEEVTFGVSLTYEEVKFEKIVEQ